MTHSGRSNVLERSHLLLVGGLVGWLVGSFVGWLQGSQGDVVAELFQTLNSSAFNPSSIELIKVVPTEILIGLVVFEHVVDNGKRDISTPISAITVAAPACN